MILLQSLFPILVAGAVFVALVLTLRSIIKRFRGVK